MSTVTASKAFDEVIDAMRSVQTEGDRWTLAEKLFALVPQGVNGFGPVIDKASTEGVLGKLSATTLRLYRDTAARWPADKRVENVSFSAHREAMNLGDTDKAVKLLQDLTKNGGASNVTVASVRKAVAVKQGKAPTTTATPANKAAIDVLKDLMGGGTQLRASITSKTEPADLDKLHAGLSKVLAHVESLRVKAAQKAAKTKAAPTKATAAPAPKAPTTKAPAKKVAGDMRGL